MAVAIRGSATARFYTTFGAWSRLGCVSHHHQRRCFTPTTSIHEANHAQPTDSPNRPQHERTSHSSNDQQTPLKRKTTEHGIPEARFARLQQHPTFLSRLQADLNVKIEPTDTLTDDGRRLIRITADGNRAHSYVRSLLLRHNDSANSLDKVVFGIRRGDYGDKAPVMLAPLPSEALDLLQDNSNELLLRIEQTFSVKLAIKPRARDGSHVVAITGERHNLVPARAFLQSLHLDLEEPSQHQEDKVDTPLANSPMPTSTSSKSAQTASETSLAILKDDFKATMRAVPSGVAVLVTRVPSAQSDIDPLRGMTVSSLCSITLEPEPIISFSIREPSRTLDCITAGQPFTVNFLNAHAKGAAIADIFSRPHEDPSQPFRTLRASGLAQTFQDVPYGPAIEGPQIRSRFTCELLPGKSLEIGDHTVVFARVIGTWMSSVMQIPNYKRVFLGYAQAGYRSMHGNTITPAEIEVLEHTQTDSISSEILEQINLSRQRRIRIGNIPPTALAADVRLFLKENGLVFHSVAISVTDGQNPSYCFVRFRTENMAREAVRRLHGANFKGNTVNSTLVPVTQLRPEVKTPESQALDESALTDATTFETGSTSTESTSIESTSIESTSIESTSTEHADSDVVDAYWRMALDEDDEADVLEERAADQRALGEAEKPIDHPAANAEGDKQ